MLHFIRIFGKEHYLLIIRGFMSYNIFSWTLSVVSTLCCCVNCSSSRSLVHQSFLISHWHCHTISSFLSSTRIVAKCARYDAILVFKRNDRPWLVCVCCGLCHIGCVSQRGKRTHGKHKKTNRGNSRYAWCIQLGTVHTTLLCFANLMLLCLS